MATILGHASDGGYRQRRAGLVRLLHRVFRSVRRSQERAIDALGNGASRHGLTHTDIEIEADKLSRKP